MSELIAVGLDPSLRNFGMVKVGIDLDTLIVQVKESLLIETEMDHSKQVRKGSDDLRRCREVVVGLQNFAAGATFGFAEVPSGGAKSASALKGLSMATALLAACPVPLIEVNPAEVKLATVGKKTAAKEDMIEWAIERHPETQWMTFKRLGKIEFNAKNEHIADAICAVYAGIRTEQFKQAVAITRGALGASKLAA